MCSRAIFGGYLMNIKTGLDFFYMGTKFSKSDEFKYINSCFGIKGKYTVIELLAWIYDHGYYTGWNDNISLLFAKEVGVKSLLVDDVVRELLKCGFFDNTLFERFHILTNRAIQERFLIATNRRKYTTMQAEYLLVDVSGHPQVKIQDVNILNQNVNILNQDVNILNQKKVKESKIKESKENNNIIHHHPVSSFSLNPDIETSTEKSTKMTIRISDDNGRILSLESFYQKYGKVAERINAILDNNERMRSMTNLYNHIKSTYSGTDSWINQVFADVIYGDSEGA